MAWVVSILLLYSTTLIPVMATHACAACRFQGRRCTSDCPLLPFFPAEDPVRFRNVHRLFKVCTMRKILNSAINAQVRQDAMTSIIYESNMRLRFPVSGCYGIIGILQSQLQQAIDDTRLVQAQIEMIRRNQAGPSTSYTNHTAVLDLSNYHHDPHQHNFIQYDHNGLGVPLQADNSISNEGHIYLHGESNNAIQNPSFANNQEPLVHVYPNQQEPIHIPTEPTVYAPHDSSSNSIHERRYISESVDRRNLAGSSNSTAKLIEDDIAVWLRKQLLED